MPARPPKNNDFDPEFQNEIDHHTHSMMRREDEKLYSFAKILNALTGRPIIECFSLVQLMQTNRQLKKQFEDSFNNFLMVARLSNFEELNTIETNIENKAFKLVEAFRTRKDEYNVQFLKVKNNFDYKTYQSHGDKLITLIDRISSGQYVVEPQKSEEISKFQESTGLKLVEKGWLVKYWSFEDEQDAKRVREKLVVDGKL